MKRVIKSASIADEEMLKVAQDIHKKAEALLAALDKAPGYVLEKCELYDLYDKLNEDVPAIAFTIKTMSGPKKPQYEDMW